MPRKMPQTSREVVIHRETIIVQEMPDLPGFLGGL